MGYRDDNIALESSCQALQQDADRLEAELRSLEAERAGLQREVQRRRWRLRGRRLLGWAGRHKLLCTVILAGVLIPSCLHFRDYSKRFWEKRRTEEVMRKLGCTCILNVISLPPEATVIIDDRQVGTTPYRERICPGAHLVRVTADWHYTWQQLVQVPAKGDLALRAELHSINTNRRPPGTVILSDPPDALIFLDHIEVGRTPLFVPLSKLPPGPFPMTAVAKPGYAPLWLRPRHNETIAFSLAPAKDSHGRRR